MNYTIDSYEFSIDKIVSMLINVNNYLLTFKNNHFVIIVKYR